MWLILTNLLRIQTPKHLGLRIGCCSCCCKLLFLNNVIILSKSMAKCWNLLGWILQLLQNWTHKKSLHEVWLENRFPSKKSHQIFNVENRGCQLVSGLLDSYYRCIFNIKCIMYLCIIYIYITGKNINPIFIQILALERTYHNVWELQINTGCKSWNP